MKKQMKILLSIVAILLLAVTVFLLNPGSVVLKAQEKVVPLGAEVVAFTLTNRTLRLIEYGEPFTLEYFEDGKWRKIDETEIDIMFQLPLYLLWPLSSVSIPYLVSAYSYLQRPGDYRIVTQIYGPEGKQTLYGNFSVA